MALTNPPPLTTRSAAPAATSHSFLGTSVNVTSARPAARSSELIGDRSHILDFEPCALEGLPLTPLYFAPARKHQRSIQTCSLTRLSRFSIQRHSGIKRAEDHLIGRRVEDAPPATGFPSSTIATETQNSRYSRDEFASAIERVYHPNQLFTKANWVVQGLFRQPPFTIARKRRWRRTIVPAHRFQSPDRGPLCTQSNTSTSK